MNLRPALLLFSLLTTMQASASQDPPAPAAPAHAIEELLATYTRSVSQGDRHAFEALLLDPAIPFHGLAGGKFAARDDAPLASIQNYAGFRKSVFESGRKLAQRFYDVKIAQEGDLAQVSLRFETLVVATGDGAQGWKTLDLLRVGGRWKIASEFYTVHPLATDGQAPRLPPRP